MKSKIIVAVLIVLVVTGAIVGIKYFQVRKLIAAGKAAPAPIESVSSTTVREEKWEETLNAVGTVTAVHGVDVTTELPGTVREIAFEPGSVVTNGALLVRLDTSTEEAQLRALEAQADLARINAERARALRAANTISQSELDSAEAALKQTIANADAVRAAIEKKTIRAPFAGRLGIRQINLGEYVDTGKAIVSLQSLSPVFVNFSLPQQDLARLKTGMKVHVTTDTYPDKLFSGTITALNPDLNVITRNVRIQATLDNSEELLQPGMFTRVEVLLQKEEPVLSIPATAVLSAPFGDSVYVIEESTNAPAATGTNSAPSLVVRQQFIRTGRGKGDFISVTAGLQAGQKIVSSGLFKLRNGMNVVEHNELAPKPSEKPKPANG